MLACAFGRALLAAPPRGARGRKTSAIKLLKLAEERGAHPEKIKRFKEKATKPDPEISHFLNENEIGKPTKTAEKRRLWFKLTQQKYAPTFLGQVKPQMRFWTAAIDETQLPLPRLPEVAICGRSNSGKSTLINYLVGRNTAMVRSYPGSTTEVVFWKIGKPSMLCMVDLPGYGYAEATAEKRLQWSEFALWYLRTRANLRRVLLLMDCRHGLKPTDKAMISFLEKYNVPWTPIVTKCDLLRQDDLARRLTLLGSELSEYHRMQGEPIPIAAKKRMGMEEVRKILDPLKVKKTSNQLWTYLLGV